MDYDWPGNVRELENFIIQATVFGELPKIFPDNLETNRLTLTESIDKIENSNVLDISNKSWDEIEKEVLKRLLSKYKWNVQAVSRHLKLARSTIYDKIKRYNLKREEK